MTPAYGVHCPQGHASESSDYCDVCGAPMEPGGPAQPQAPQGRPQAPQQPGPGPQGRPYAGQPGSPPPGYPQRGYPPQSPGGYPPPGYGAPQRPQMPPPGGGYPAQRPGPQGPIPQGPQVRPGVPPQPQPGVPQYGNAPQRPAYDPYAQPPARAAEPQPESTDAAGTGAGTDEAICPNCRTSNLPDALFCEACGYDFTTGTLPRPRQASILDLDTPLPSGTPAPRSEPSPARAAEEPLESPRSGYLTEPEQSTPAEQPNPYAAPAQPSNPFAVPAQSEQANPYAAPAQPEPSVQPQQPDPYVVAAQREQDNPFAAANPFAAPEPVGTDDSAAGPAGATTPVDAGPDAGSAAADQDSVGRAAPELSPPSVASGSTAYAGATDSDSEVPQRIAMPPAPTEPVPVSNGAPEFVPAGPKTPSPPYPTPVSSAPEAPTPAAPPVEEWNAPASAQSAPAPTAEVPSAPAPAAETPSAPASAAEAPTAAAPAAETAPAPAAQPAYAPVPTPAPAEHSGPGSDTVEWVAEVWIDPDWYRQQESPDPLPSPGLPQVLPLRGRSILIGRYSRSRNITPDIDCGTDSGISRRQAQLTSDGTRWYIEDLDSANGTYVADASGPLPTEPLPPSRKFELDADDRIFVGAWTRVVLRRATPEDQDLF